MLPIILLAVAAVLVIFVTIVAMRPSDFRITRTATMAASQQTVFEQINDFHNWEDWNPWGKLDPNMRATYAGPDRGTGASYHWLGNKNVGEGRMTITESRPHDLVRIRLEFLKPFKATNTTEFILEPVDSQTTVTWTMFGKNTFMAKSMGLFMNMDSMIGGMYEKGLAAMKTKVESLPAPQN